MSPSSSPSPTQGTGLSSILWKHSGLRIAGICLILIIGGVVALISSLRYYTSTVVEHTAPLPGDPTHFDPIASYEAIHAHAGTDTKLIKLEVSSVRSDGTLDLNAECTPAPRASYSFYRQLNEAPKDAPPIGAGGNVGGKWYEPVSVEVYRPGELRSVHISGQGKSETYQYYNRGMERNTLTPTGVIPGNEIPSPACAFADLWKTALEQGAPKEAVATITYDVRGYTFVIRGTNIRYTFGHQCERTAE